MKAMLFPGQGAQFVGMGKELAGRSAPARRIFDRACEVLGYDIARICFEGPEEELTRTDRAQPAIYATSAAAVEDALASGRARRSEFGAAAGLSLGEYTALWFAGVLAFDDGLRLVQLRGEAMQRASEASPSGMVTLLGADRDLAERVCDLARGAGVLVVANLNSPGQVVVSGDRDALGRVPAAARDLGVRRTIPLKVAGAFHSPVMQPARDALVAALDGTPMADARIDVYANATGEPVRDGSVIRALLGDQVVRPVLWEASCRRMIADGIRGFLEPPPGSVLCGMMRKIEPEADCASIGQP